MREDTVVAERVVAILTQRLGLPVDVITPEADLSEDLDLDSVDAVELNLALETAFGVSLPDDLFADVRTVQDLVDLVRRADVLTEAERA